MWRCWNSIGKPIVRDVAVLNILQAEAVGAEAIGSGAADESFDHAISIGVLHHTPDCRRGFHELARVTAPGGTIVVFLYNYWNIYNLIYHAFAPVRSLMPLHRIPRWMLWTLQPFAKSHLGQRLNDTQLRNLLGDKLWTPQATFHSVAQVRRWGIEEGLTFVANKKFYLGYANVMCYVKNGRSDPDIHRELRLQCPLNGHGLMENRADGYTCGSCGKVYPIVGRIIDCLCS